PSAREAAKSRFDLGHRLARAVHGEQPNENVFKIRRTRSAATDRNVEQLRVQRCPLTHDPHHDLQPRVGRSSHRSTRSTGPCRASSAPVRGLSASEVLAISGRETAPMPIARFALVALDSPDPQALAGFYAAITGWEITQPYDSDS